jgi:hypothetical protein
MRFGIVSECVRKNFESDVAVDAGVVCPANLAHATRAECGNDFIVAEACSAGQGISSHDRTVRTADSDCERITRYTEVMVPQCLGVKT